MVRFIDVPFMGEAIATHDGKVIWHNFHSGDCPPDISNLYVKYMYVEDKVLVFELTEKGE